MSGSDCATVIVSVVTLLVNICYYIFIQTRLGYKYETKRELSKICSEFFTYLSEIVSYDEFEGVPTTIRNYSMRIHLCFKSGQADQNISEQLEKVFQMTKMRKGLVEKKDIDSWNDEFRTEVTRLRRAVSKYCGSF